MIVQTFHVDNGPLIQCRIDFSNATRRGRGVVQISEIRIKAPQQTIAQKYVVIACVTKLANIGYTLPTLSSVLIQAIMRTCVMMLRAFVQALLGTTKMMW